MGVIYGRRGYEKEDDAGSYAAAGTAPDSLCATASADKRGNDSGHHDNSPHNYDDYNGYGDNSRKANYNKLRS